MEVHQLNFDGVPVAVDDHARAIDILTHYEDARNDRQAALFWWWHDYDGLGDIMDQATWKRFYLWLLHRATSAKTVCNRIMEVQAERPELGPSPEVARQREWRAHAGKLR